MTSEKKDPVSALDPSEDQIPRAGHEAADLIAHYLASVPSRPISPNTSAAEVRARLDTALPEEGEDFSSILDVIRNEVIPLSRHNGHPRFFGYVVSPGSAITAIVEMLTAALRA